MPESQSSSLDARVHESRKALDAHVREIVRWHFDPAIGMQICKEAVENNFWPLFEVEDGKYKINYKPSEKKPKTPLADWMKQQGRFKHLFKPGNEGLLVKCQEHVDHEWEKLLKLEAMTAEP